MPTIISPGWPLETTITCAVCETKWMLGVGDAALIVVDLGANTLTVDAGCPGCDTVYTATKTIGAPKAPLWIMAETQPSHENSAPDDALFVGTDNAYTFKADAEAPSLYVEPLPPAKPNTAGAVKAEA